MLSNLENLATHTPQYIREMTIVYLVASFEKVLAAILKTILLDQPKSLTSSNKQITFKEILSCDDLNELRNYMIDKEISDVFYESIDGMNVYLKNKFNFPLDSNNGWHEFREVFYRRNLIIHNGGFPNEIYRRKTGHKGLGKLMIEKDYLTKSFEVFYFYSKLISDHFYKKKFNRRIKAKRVV